MSPESLEPLPLEGSTRRLGPLLLLCGITAAYCLWILSLPLFPTQDGPVHLYYARVLQALLFHVDPGIFPNYFTIKHVLPPYSLYYYLLIGLAHFVSFPVADKLVICFYVVSFIFGFRFLARSLGPSADLTTLLATPLVLSWPLVMGFVNFCLSTSMAFFALGLWIRSNTGNGRSTQRQLGFVALCIAMMLTHPVPLLLVLAYAALDLALKLPRQRRLTNWRQALAFAAAACTILYVKAFTVASVLRQEDTERMPYLYTIAQNAGPLLAMQTITAFGGRTLLDRFYRGSLLLLLVIALVWGARELVRAYRTNTWTLGNRWFILGLLLAVAVPIIPPDLNNSHYFSARLVVWIWLVLLAAASSIRPARPSLASHIAAAFILLVTASILVLGNQRIRPVADHLARIEQAPASPGHRVFLMLLDGDHLPVLGVNYDPYAWSGVRVIRRSDSVLYTPPWLDLPIIPIGMQDDMPGNVIAPLDLDSALELRRALLRSETQRAFVFSHINSVVIMHGVNPITSEPDPMLTLDPIRNRHWKCVVQSVESTCDFTQPADSPSR